MSTLSGIPVNSRSLIIGLFLPYKYSYNSSLSCFEISFSKLSGIIPCNNTHLWSQAKQSLENVIG